MILSDVIIVVGASGGIACCTADMCSSAAFRRGIALRRELIVLWGSISDTLVRVTVPRRCSSPPQHLSVHQSSKLRKTPHHYASSFSAVQTTHATTTIIFIPTAVHNAPASPTPLCAHSPPIHAPTNSNTGAPILLFRSTLSHSNNLGSPNRSQ